MVANNHECGGVAEVKVGIERVILEERLLNLNALNLAKNRRPELYF
jgi:hypothetical protein